MMTHMVVMTHLGAIERSITFTWVSINRGLIAINASMSFIKGVKSSTQIVSMLARCRRCQNDVVTMATDIETTLVRFGMLGITNDSSITLPTLQVKMYYIHYQLWWWIRALSPVFMHLMG